MRKTHTNQWTIDTELDSPSEQRFTKSYFLQNHWSIHLTDILQAGRLATSSRCPLEAPWSQSQLHHPLLQLGALTWHSQPWHPAMRHPEVVYLPLWIQFTNLRQVQDICYGCSTFHMWLPGTDCIIVFLLNKQGVYWRPWCFHSLKGFECFARVNSQPFLFVALHQM